MKPTRSPHLSLIIPIYNEYTRLITGVKTALSYLTKQQYRWECILVDDGSDVPVSDLLSQAVSRRLLPKTAASHLTVVRLKENKGKGAALRAGVKRARGQFIVFSDIDFSVPITTLAPMRRTLRKAPVVIGSRRLAKSTIVVHQPWLRETSGRIFTFLSNVLCDTRVADATCGFKGFQRRVAKRIFSASRINRWVYDTEILFLARRWGIPIVELPVFWSDKKGSKVRPRDTIGSLADLLRIRWNDLRGKYK